ncbi:PQQ-binding-like beta-propeller repeat protein [Natrialbaceae archaeon AArc-T1-2]|uniref:outer membrane protein assembly factor BamB family protein n=1 Tax=Natrialbaceae archaeon AArc-T1-2 TaxID=3053904 RepID=UPI00255A892E|nr:PQQ-binding-like beta-propeller repeat protein [Natrialbaceae archaeon AArc-T1-2]WIV66080.1 PQQ-binding-like beta-propeller repeat protein [Natrialbaceae archaeon AArc-T1-2]
MTGESSSHTSSQSRRRDRITTTRRSLCAALGVGALAGCLQLEEAGDDTQSDGTAQDDGTTDTAFEEEVDGTPVDDPESLELVSAWERDLRDVVTLEGAFLGVAGSRTAGVDAPRLERYAADGEVTWASDEIDSDYRFEFHRDDDVVARGATVVAVARNGHDGAIHAFDTDTGERRWSDDVRLDRNVGGWALSLANDLAVTAVVSDESADETLVRGYDAGDGEQRWEREIDLGYVTGVEHQGDGFFVVGWRDGGGEIVRVDLAAGGNVGGETTLDVASPGYVRGEGGDRLYFRGNEIHAYDPANNEYEWSLEVDRQFGPGVDVDGETLYGGNRSGWIVARAATDGSMRWDTRVEGGVTDSLSVAGGIVWARTDRDELVAIDASTGDVVDTLEGAFRIAATPTQIFVDDTAYDLES